MINSSRNSMGLAIEISYHKLRFHDGFSSGCHILRWSGSRLQTNGCGSPAVKISDHGRHVTSSSPIPLKTRCVGEGCSLNLSRAQTSSRWCGVVVRRGGASSSVILVS
ncbi:uncharacterized protein TNCV_3016021 [Trichonephila clavipes]|nr:uncharacterized protein TNCV_3016021 [Trichonephila clavipes]